MLAIDDVEAKPIRQKKNDENTFDFSQNATYLDGIVNFYYETN